jgi:hypothetical protein
MERDVYRLLFPLLLNLSANMILKRLTCTVQPEIYVRNLARCQRLGGFGENITNHICCQKLGQRFLTRGSDEITKFAKK